MEELAALAGMRPPTVSHHLERLLKARLVSARPDGYCSSYHLKTRTIEEKAACLLAKDTLEAFGGPADRTPYERQVLENYFTPEGQLKQLPTQQKKAEVVLRHIVESFELRRRYPEKEVNKILAGFHEDTAWLRRNLVMSGLMKR